MTQETVVPERALVRSEDASLLEKLEQVKAVLAPDLTRAELELFGMVAVRSGLDPFARQIFAVKRKGKVTFQTGIDGYRSIAARTGEYDGQDEPIFGEDCPCSAMPQPHPKSATTRVYRKGVSRPIGATAFWHEYVPEGDAFMWRRMPHVMLAKVSEALALRKAFPWDPNSRSGIGADIYTDEEMQQADRQGSGGPSSLQERLHARASGISVAEFRDAVAGIDPEEIRKVAEGLYPGVESRNLTGEQLEAIRDRLLSPREYQDGSIGGEVESESTAEETEAPGPSGEHFDPATEVNPTPDPAPGSIREAFDGPARCGVPSVYGEGHECDQAKGHRGYHRYGDSESWPR